MTENYVDPTRDAFRAFRSLNGEGEIHMLNLVRLRQTAVYPQQHAWHGRALSGEEAYRAYGEESGRYSKRWVGQSPTARTLNLFSSAQTASAGILYLLPSTHLPTHSFRWSKTLIISKL